MCEKYDQVRHVLKELDKILCIADDADDSVASAARPDDLDYIIKEFKEPEQDEDL